MKYIITVCILALAGTATYAQMDEFVQKATFLEDIAQLVESGDLAAEDSLLLRQSVIVMKLETLNDPEEPNPFEMTYAEVLEHAHKRGYHFLSMLLPVSRDEGSATYSNGMEITQDDARILMRFIKDHKEIDYTNLQLEEVVDMAGG